MKINPQLVNWLKHELASDTTRVAIYEGSNPDLSWQMILTCLYAGLIAFDEYTNDVIYYHLTLQGEIALGIQANEDESTGERVAIARPEYNLAAGYDTYRHAPAPDDDAYTACGQVAAGAYDFKDLHTMNMCLDCVAARIETLPNVDVTPQLVSPNVPQAGDTSAYRVVDIGGYHSVYKGADDTDANHVVTFNSEYDCQVFIDGLNKETAALRAQLASAQERAAPATPPTDSGVAESGYRFIEGSTISEILDTDGNFIYSGTDKEDIATLCSLLNTKTAALRAQLASAQERVAGIATERDALLDVINHIHEAIESDRPNAAILGAIHELITPYID